MLPRRLSNLVLSVVVFGLLCPTAAWAYLDPASGSIFLQLLLGGIAGVSLLVKMYWRKLLAVLGLVKDETSGGDSSLPG
jgi:hypothetical protein